MEIANKLTLDSSGWPQQGLAAMIMAEQEHQDPAPALPKNRFTAMDWRPKAKDAMARMARAAWDHAAGRPPCLAFSGGDDSLALLDLAAAAGIQPRIIWIDTQMEYPGSEAFISSTVARYGFELRKAKADHTPREQWERTGWPMLGKTAARLWNQRHTGLGFKINVSECCRAMKIGPARTLARNLDARFQFTGQRGGTDDGLRGMRTLKDGAIFYQERDRLWISNPLTGWTDADINAYLEERGIPRHPAKISGAKTIGCVFCGGGSQFTNSGYRILRKIWPKAWRQFMVEWRGGEIILALKYGTSLDLMRGAIETAGGLERLAKTQPWLFDFTRKTPIQGYQK